jgi:hypothetical protein
VAYATPLPKALHASGNAMLSQKEICDKYGVTPSPCSDEDKLGIAIETLGQQPINGLRHKSENGTCGWYLWCGETLGEDADFFKSLHISHIGEYLPEIQRYLALPPGYRFLVSGEHVDVWHDPALIGT